MRSKIKSINGSTEIPGSLRKAARKAKEKASGTRAGTLRDWREASGRTAEDSRRRRDAVRDGR